MKQRLKRTRFFRAYQKMSITWKIRFGMLAISLFILLSFMGVSIQYTYTNMLDSSLNSAKRNLTFSKNNLDNLLAIVENYSVILLSDEVIQETLDVKKEPSSSELSQNEILMRKRINAITSSFKSISAVLMYDSFGNIYDTGVTLLPKESDVSLVPQDLPQWTITEPAPYYIAVPGATIRPHVISYTRNIYSYLTGRYIGKVRIFMEEAYVSKTYSQSLSDQEELYMISGDNKTISTPDPSLLYTDSQFTVSELEKSEGHLSFKNKEILYEPYQRMNSFLVYVLPRDTIYAKIYRMIWYMFVAGSLLICLCILISSYISRSLTSPLSSLTQAVKNVQLGNWNARVKTDAQDEIGILGENFNRMLEELENRTDKLIQEQKSKRQFQLEFLNQQINPHFLYNTLDNVCALAELGQTEELFELVNNLTSFYRGVLSKGKIVIPLSQEIQLAANYLNIMEIRYHYTFTYEFHVPPEFSENTALKLTLQPLLENAIYHGFETHQKGGIIRLSLRPLSSCIILILEDNGKGISREDLSALMKNASQEGTKKGFGIRNVHERIQLYYGSSYGLKIYSGSQKGTRILLKLPRRRYLEEPRQETSSQGKEDKH